MTELLLEQIGKSKISYRILGTGKRRVLFFHGFPGSSIQVEIFRSCLASHEIQAVCVDRPGCGRTDARHLNQMAQAIEDAKRVVDRLGWKTFEVMTISGGTPFGLGFARSYPAQVAAVNVICGLGPVSKLEFARMLKPQSLGALRLLPLVPGRLLGAVFALGNRAAHSSATLSLLRVFLPVSRADENVMKEASVSATLSASLGEAFVQGGVGPQRDAAAYCASWGWELEDFPLPVTFWHGEEDQILPIRMSERMSNQIPGSRLKRVMGEGHYSLAVNQIAQILGAAPRGATR
jgi:pimeloyl-ACP methyl ester carboxylesterase